MKATDIKLLPLIKQNQQFVIPLYQRIYSWREEQCLRLCEDILNAGQKKECKSYFIGSIVSVEQEPAQIGKQPPYLVIDGQQRLSTVSLLLAALVDFMRNDEKYATVSQDIIYNYLITEREEGDKKYKLLLSRSDREVFKNILDHVDHKDDASLVMQNFVRIKKWLQGKAEQNQLDPIWQGLNKLIVVAVTLYYDEDDPQSVFESMNSTGLELSQSDLIRNYMLMDLNAEEQEDLYRRYWMPMEEAFGADTYTADFDKLMRYYLTIKTNEIPKIADVYKVFKSLFSRAKEGSEWTRKDIAAQLMLYSEYYCILDRNLEKDKDLHAVFADLRELAMGVVYPLLLELYRLYKEDKINKATLYKVTRHIESYLFRRSVCDIPTNSLDKTFADMARNLDPENLLEQIESTFILLPSYRRFPNNEEFKQHFKEKNMYRYRNCSYWLRKMENFGREKEPVSIVDYTIEHIMPQNENLSKEWQDALGENWREVQSRWIHTAGNLTLTGYNTEYSDRPFNVKRDMEHGFKDSPIRLNEYLRKADTWNEEKIMDRAQELVNMALKIWATPELPSNILDRYKSKKSATVTEYGINDHPDLLKEPIQSLFEKLRQEILALDPCVKEEFLKLYVAYKAETNFADIVPGTKLKIVLNMPFKEINDPQGICENVAGKGRWENGEIRFVLSSPDSLPYATGLIRQSLERQINDDQNNL